jgi:pimeloyl-ACP methyl ester carboxylesterase
VLNFISVHLAINYFLLAFLTIVGALQFVAARHKLVGLALIGSVRKPIWGYLVAIALIAGAFTWFFAATPEVFIPGLAGSELEILFVAAGIFALAFTLLFSSILHRVQQREQPNLETDSRLRRETVYWQQVRGTLYLPEDTGETSASVSTELDEVSVETPRAAICVLPSPSEGTFSPYPLVTDLLVGGFIVLAIDWGPEKELHYPEVLGLVPGAVAYLTRRDDVNSEHIGVLGIDLGGDLALRAAGTDPQIAAVLALTPFLSQANTQPGLNILREMSYLEAIRWSGFRERGKLVAELAALDSIGKLDSRPLLLVYGDQDGITPAGRTCETIGEEVAREKLKSLPGEGHLSLSRSPVASAVIARWFRENL